MYTRRIVTSPGSQLDISAPNWEQVYKTSVKPGKDGEDGYHGKDGPTGKQVHISLGFPNIKKYVFDGC